MTNPNIQPGRDGPPLRLTDDRPPNHRTVLVGRSRWTSGDRPVSAGYRRLMILERVLDAVGECVVHGFLTAATSHGVRVKSVHARVEAVTPLPVNPGTPVTWPAGPEAIRVVVTADCDANAMLLGRLIVEARNSSPVFDMVSGGVRVEVVHGKK